MNYLSSGIPLSLLATCLLTAASPAASQAAPAGSGRGNRDQAEALAAEAQAEFKAGAFEQAARLYMKAYGKSG